MLRQAQRRTWALSAAAWRTTWATGPARGVKKAAEEAQHRVLSEMDPAARTFLTGVPEQFFGRPVEVYHQSKNPMQDGYAQAQKWKLRFDFQGQWNNSLMGWSSSRDPVNILNLEFPTAEAAVAYCERLGYKCVVQADQGDHGERHEVRKNYGDNFLYQPPRKRVDDIF